MIVKVSVCRFIMLVLVLVSLASCAGGGHRASVGLGTLSVNVVWPPVTRLIPLASNSIEVQVFVGGDEVASTVIPKPLTIASLSDIPTGDVTVTATAYPVADGSGVAQATGSTVAAVTAGNITPVFLTMGSTITHVDVTPVTVDLTTGLTTTLVATPRDANNNVVLVTPLNIVFTSLNPLIATVVPTSGLVLGVLAGGATITATEIESGVSGSATVNVKVGVSILPGSATVSILGIQLFVATVIGALNPTVTWSVVEGPSGGSINALGLYVAPLAAGTYHVRATSNQDPTQFATATVTVQSGGLIVNVN